VLDVLRCTVEGLMSPAPPAKKAKVSSCVLGHPVDVSTLAALVMRGIRVHIAGKVHRILEVELYLTGPGHLDPYTHCSAVQVHTLSQRLRLLLLRLLLLWLLHFVLTSLSQSRSVVSGTSIAWGMGDIAEGPTR
jgi:hypothetical protein